MSIVAHPLIAPSTSFRCYCPRIWGRENPI